MSSKRTIVRLTAEEHWHIEYQDQPATVCIDVDKSNVAEQHEDSDTITIYLKMESRLARLLTHPDVLAVFEKVAHELNSEL